LPREIGRRLHACIDGQQKIAPLELGTVARVVEAHELDLGSSRILGERPGRLVEAGVIHIEAQVHAESGLAQ
jgi:hypothetical protein